MVFVKADQECFKVVVLRGVVFNEGGVEDGEARFTVEKIKTGADAARLHIGQGIVPNPIAEEGQAPNDENLIDHRPHFRVTVPCNSLCHFSVFCVCPPRIAVVLGAK